MQTKQDGNLQPPSCILNHPPLALYLNQLLEALNTIRSCLLLSILSEVVQSLMISLKEAVRVLIKFYRLVFASLKDVIYRFLFMKLRSIKN